MLGPSALNHVLGLKSRIPLIILIVMSSLMLFWGDDFLKFFPVPLIGAYLLFIGLNFLMEVPAKFDIQRDVFDMGRLIICTYVAW